MPDMHILAGLPRVGTGWPRAVAVATADIAPSGADQMLIAVTNRDAIKALDVSVKLRGEAGEQALYSVDGYVEDIAAVRAIDSNAKIIGCLPEPLSEK